MRTKLHTMRRRASGYALLMVIVIAAASLLILAESLSRTSTVTKLDARNNEFVLEQNAAEAAVDKVFARMSYDFSTPGLGYGAVSNNVTSGYYQTNVPNARENPYWTNFIFSDAQGHDNRIYVHYLHNYTGPLPSQFPGCATENAPVYRIVANVRMRHGAYNLTNAVQEDVLLSLVPISNTAIFFNSLLEFTWCAPFTINGRVHANDSIYTGTSYSSYLKFNGPVSAVGMISSPAWAGFSTRDFQGPVTYNAGYATNVPWINLSINMTNTHSLIEQPPKGESPTSIQGTERLYNQAQVVMVVSNQTVTARLQSGDLPGADQNPIILTSTNTPSALSTNFPFLTTSHTFTDQRENKTILASQVDVGAYRSWLATNSNIRAKFPPGSGTYPTILYVADDRTTSSSQMTAVRLADGTALPENGGLGFTVATPDPLYVWGNYNQTNPAYLNTTNTSSGTVPAALMSDALTVLSPAWRDSQSSYPLGSWYKNRATSTTINAAILTGLVYSTGPNTGQFSGGVMNITRLLEDWGNGGSTTLTLNTSLINLFASTHATAQFKNPGYYYYAPTRKFSFDLNFNDPAKQPPGMPCALLPVRFNFAVPPPDTVTYNVKP